MKPRDPAEAPKNEEKKEWEAEIPPPPPHTHPPCQLCSTESFHHFWFFWGYTLTWDASHQQLWILYRSHKLRQIICKASEFINSLGHTKKLQHSGWQEGAKNSQKEHHGYLEFFPFLPKIKVLRRMAKCHTLHVRAQWQLSVKVKMRIAIAAYA